MNCITHDVSFITAPFRIFFIVLIPGLPSTEPDRVRATINKAHSRLAYNSAFLPPDGRGNTEFLFHQSA
jgi:hypothetical protein